MKKLPSWHTLILAGLTLIFGGAYLFSLAENSSYADSLYWTVTVFTTVGFGDITPSTILGRLIFGFISLAAVFVIIPLVVVKLVPNPNEFTHAEQLVVLESLNDIKKAILVEARAKGGVTMVKEMEEIFNTHEIEELKEA